MIGWIRQQFCNHNFIHVQRVNYMDCIMNTYMCTKCGYIRKVHT